MTASQNPTLSGAERGRVRALREVPGGIYFIDPETGAVKQRPAWLRPTSERQSGVCVDYARQYLEARGDGKAIPGQMMRMALFFELHFALIEPPREGVKLTPMFDAPAVDEKGRLNIATADGSPLGDLAAGEFAKLSDELQILRTTQTPRQLTHGQWEAIVSEGKEQSLRTLHSRHGSSALIQVLHGLTGQAWPESEPGNSGGSTP